MTIYEPNTMTQMKQYIVRMVLLCMVMMCGVGTAWGQSNALSLDPTDVTYVNAGNGDTNFSTSGHLYANFSTISNGVLTNQLSAYGGTDITIVKFDASALPSGASITSAILKFHSVCTVATKNSQLAIASIGTNWSAETVTWNNLDKSASSKTDLQYSNDAGVDQSCEVKQILSADDDKVVAFAIFTNTGRQQEITNLKLDIDYSEKAAEKFQYSVTTSLGTTIESGELWDYETKNISWSKYLQQHEIWYIADMVGTTISVDNKDVVVNCTATDVLYFYEAESVLSKTYGNENGLQYSGGRTAGVASGANLSSGLIKAGNYVVYVSSTVRRVNEDILNVQVSYDGTDWTNVGSISLTSNVGGDYYLGNVRLNSDGYIRLVEGKNQNMCHYVDYVYVTKMLEEYHYTVKAVDSRGQDLKVLDEGDDLEGESKEVLYPEHILVGSTLYTVPQEKMTANDYYRFTFIPDHDNYEVVIPYDGTQIRDVVFYTEGEDIEGVSTATNDVRASKGQMGYTANAETYLPVTELRQGIYQIYIRGVNGNAAARTVNFKAGDRIVYTDQISNGTEIRRNSALVYIGETSTLSFACEGSSQSGLDNMYIVRIGDFEPTPVYTLNLRTNNGAIANVPKTLSVHAENTDTYTWYESTTVDGAGTVVQSAMTAEEGGNRYTFTRETDAPVTYFYCVATGFSGVEKKSFVAQVTTVNESVPGAFVNGYTQDYESGATVDWYAQNATVSIENHNGSNMIGINGEKANGARTAYMPLTENLKYLTPDHVTNDWGLEFDFYTVNMDYTPTQQALQIYRENTEFSEANGGQNAPVTNTDCFVSFICDNTNNQYKVYIADTEQSTITLNPSAKYHASVQVLLDPKTRSNTGQLSVSISDADGNVVYSQEKASPFEDDILLGGIMYVLPRRNIKTAHAYFDNVTLKVMTTDLAVNSDLPDFVEVDDDEYLLDGAGLNFDVPAATEFNWYVSSVVPTKDANGTTEPRLKDDGSVEWTQGRAFMTVVSLVGRATTTIEKTKGVALSTSGKRAVEPTADNEGKYAWGLQQTYRNVQTVYDEAEIDNTTATPIYRYYPEATASGSRWHYLRQLKEGENDHLDYVWCVASNPLGDVTSKVTQINVYPQQPFISVHIDDETGDAAGERDDMTIPANYLMRLSTVRIQAQNLIFNTTNMPVPYSTKSEIIFRDESRNEYLPDSYPATQKTKWLHGDTEWTGLLTTTSFTDLDDILEKHASVHGFYKSIPTYVPVDFVYGLRQLGDAGFQPIGSHGGAEYRIGPADNPSLLATQEYFYDYGKAAPTPLGDVSEKTTWDWSKLPQRSYLTYNVENLPDGVETKNYGSIYVVDPESRLLGPLMGQEYIMADFYRYKPSELDGFPSDKVILGLEVVNDPTDKCMQGNAFIFKPTEEGTLTVTFSSTNSDVRYLELCTRDAVNGADRRVMAYNTVTSDGNKALQTLTMDITSAMKKKYVVVRARNKTVEPLDADQYFRIYSATYTPDNKPVEFAEWLVKDKENLSDPDVYKQIEVGEKSDGYVSIASTSPGAVIKYKIVEGELTDEQIGSAVANIDYLDAEEHTYVEDFYTDSEDHKIGIHCRVNSVIFAWAEGNGMNRSTVGWLRTNAAVYPVDMRFMEDFETSTITTKEQFDEEYWGTAQSDLSGMTMQQLIYLSTDDAPKAWNATKYGTATIDGVPYNAANFGKLYITHGTVIDIYIKPTADYTFTGWGAPSWGGSGVIDMMRSGAKAKFVHYHLLYDKAKAKTTAGIAFLVANFTRRTAPLTAHLYVKEEDDGNTDDYQIPMNVSGDDKIIAPLYHSAYNLAGGHSVTHWTDDYRPGDAETVYEDYLPGTPKQIYQNTIIKPVMRANSFLDNYQGRTNPLVATWWFTTDHLAQNLIVRDEFPGFNMPYVTPVKRSVIGTVEEGSDDDITFDVPLTITPGPTGRLDNTINSDWCAVGRGTRFTVPVCSGTDVSMEVRSPMSSAAGGTTFAGEYPTLWKVKYKGEAGYTVTSTPDPSKTVEAYIYRYTYAGDGETCDIVLGNDYSYLRNIGVSMPVVTSNRDAALITLDFSQLMRHLDIESLGYQMAGHPEYAFHPKPAPLTYGDGQTGDGYEFDHKSENISLYKTHYSGEHGAIYYDGVSGFKVGEEVPANVPYVNGVSGYTYSTQEGGTFIVGPFRSITHIRYKQGSSRLSGGGWIMKVGRKTFDGMFDWIQTKVTGNINEDRDTRRKFSVADFNDVQWSEPKAGSISNSRTPVWVEMDIEEHIYPVGKDNNDISLIERPDFDQQQGDIWLKFEANNPDVYLFAIEIYGIDPTSDQQMTLETGLLAADDDNDTDLEPSLRAGSIYHFPYLLKLDEKYQPVTDIVGSDNKLMQYNAGREVSLTATPNTGYDFLKWVKPDGNGGWEDVSTANPYVFNIPEDTQLRAVFVHRGIINYTTDRTNYGLVPDQQQTDGQGGFTVADNRGMYAGDGKSLRQWQDALPTHEWYTGKDVSNTFNVSTNVVGKTNASTVTQSRAVEGGVMDVYPQFSANTLELLDVVGRNGTTARWLFGKKNGALTMEGAGTTPRMVTQVEITGNIDEVDGSGNISQRTISDVIDVSMEMQANVNNAGRADEYATITPGNRFTIPATRGMQIDMAAKTAVECSINGGDFELFTAAFKYYGNESQITLSLRNADNPDAPIELEYIQATYYQRAQKPVLSMQKVDVIGTGASNNIQVDVQTSANPTAVRFYTVDGSDPQYEATAEGIIPKPGTGTRLVRGNYITINESQIKSGSQLKVISVCPDRPDSRLSILDLEPYDPSLGLATYVYDSRIISIHNDQIFQKLLKEHKGHFNLLSYDLNPDAARIPDIITDYTTVFVTSDAVRDHLMKALTNPSDPAAHGQTFSVEPLIVGTPLTVSWKESANTGSWLPMTWVSQVPSEKPIENPVTPTSPATITYTEMLRRMKDQKPSSGGDKTYEEIYRDNGQIAEGNPYILAFYDNMLLDGSKLCISNTTDNAPENLSANGTQLVFNATELLTRITDGTPADVSTFDKTLFALMGPTKNPQVIDIAMTYTQDVIDLPADSPLWTALDAPMLSALSDGKTEMSMPYLAATYPQFRAGTINNYGTVTVTNVEVATAGDDLATAEKLGAQGVKDLATIIELTDPNNADFKREYRVEYNVTTEELTFHKEGDKWVCDETDLCTIEESTKDGCPFFKLLGPQNYGIKSVSFNGYAVAPSEYFENGEIMEGKTIWGQGEKYNDDAMLSPTAYHVTTPLIPEYPSTSAEADRTPLSNSGLWMTSEFPWGFKDCYQMAFSLLNINEYVGDIKVTYYRRQAESPKLLSAKVKYKGMERAIKDDMVLDEPNGEFVLEFNSVMHEVRKPGTYDSATGQETVTWTVHVIPEENYPYDRNNPTDFDGVDANDIPGKRIELYSEGGTNTLRFQYWNLTPGKKYYLHIPFQVLRGAVGTGVPYIYPTTDVTGLPEEHMSWTDYPGVPYFDIPFTVKVPQYVHKPFDYIVNNDDWWEVLKEKPGSATHGEYDTAEQLPSYATWDGTFTNGINQVQGNTSDDHYYMHVQKKFDASGNPVAYTYDQGNGLIGFTRGNFSISGEGQDSTIITAEPAAYADSDYRGLREDMDGNQTATIHLDASNVYMQDLTIRNTQKGLNQDGQEYPALFDHGERNVFYNVNIDGYEESFAVFGSLSYLKNSRVSGFGDFIVGSGDVWLDSCDIVLRNRELINLCAPSTKVTNKWGIIFNDCNIIREAGATQVLDHNWTLARPWDGYDDIPKSPAVTFLNTSIEVLPTNSGYGSLSENLPLRFHEYGTMTLDGTAISLSTRSISNCTPAPESDAPVLTPQEAEQYSVMNVFGRDNGGYDPESLTRQARAPHLDNDGMVLHWTADPSDLCYLVYYLGDGEEPDYQHAQMFCCVPGTDDPQAYCYLTDHDRSPIFRTGGTAMPVSFSEMWYGRRKSDPDGADYDGDKIPGMGKASPSRLWFTVRAANQMGGLSEMSNAIMYHAARQYRTTITKRGVRNVGDDEAYSTIYLDFQALAPDVVSAYALTGVTSPGGEGTDATTLTFTRVTNSETPGHRDVIYANQGYLIKGPYGKSEGKTVMEHTFIETTAEPDVKLESYLVGTVGEFLNVVSEQGLGETNEQNVFGQGWSIVPKDYADVSRGNVSAYTLQNYNDVLGFYKFTGSDFAHHRAYLDTEMAAKILMVSENLSQDDALGALNRGIRFVIKETDGSETVIDNVFCEPDTSEGIFDLMGRRVSSRRQLQHGHIYIIDGVKVLWK